MKKVLNTVVFVIKAINKDFPIIFCISGMILTILGFSLVIHYKDSEYILYIGLGLFFWWIGSKLS